MIEARHALEISPKSLFGRHSYPHEQNLIRQFTQEIDESPVDFRRRKIKEHLERAREILNDLIP